MRSIDENDINTLIFHSIKNEAGEYHWVPISKGAHQYIEDNYDVDDDGVLWGYHPSDMENVRITVIFDDVPEPKERI